MYFRNIEDNLNDKIVLLFECMLSHFIRGLVFATLWIVAHQAPLSLGFSRRKMSRLSRPLPGDLPNPGVGPVSFMSPALAGGFFITSATWEALCCCC